MPIMIKRFQVDGSDELAEVRWPSADAHAAYDVCHPDLKNGGWTPVDEKGMGAPPIPDIDEAAVRAGYYLRVMLGSGSKARSGDQK